MYHFMDKAILSLEMLSSLSKVTQKSAAGPNSEFNSSDSRLHLFLLVLHLYCLNSKLECIF